MDSRQELILRIIVDEYVRSAEPVASRWIAENPALDVSPATVRNDMATLERDGYIHQPHTSAGRVPTEKAYIHYLQNFVDASRKPQKEKHFPRAVAQRGDEEATLKTLARALVDMSGETAIVAFGPHSSFYTGVANLFQKPDFGDLDVVRALSGVVDRFDEVVGQIFESIQREPQVLIGSENPFGKDMSAILVKYTLPNRHVGILGLVGPMRMDYSRNLQLLEEAADSLDKFDL